MTWGTIAYMVAGQLLGGAGAVVLILALIGDRLRGNHTRRRCPKCWFDLSGTPGLTCPECGKTAAREDRLFRSRRRWAWAAAGVLVMLGAGVVTLWPSWRRGEWFSLLPGVLKVELWEYTDKPAQSFEMALKTIEGDRLKARAMEVGLTELVRATAPGVRPSVPTVNMFGIPETATQQILRAEYVRWPLNERSQAAMMTLLTDSARGLQDAALAAVQYRPDLPETLREAMCAIATDAQAPGSRRWAAIEGVGVLGIEDARARKVLVGLLATQVRAETRDPIAGWLLRASRFHGEELVEAYATGTPEVREALARAAGGQVDDYAAAHLFPLLLDQFLTGEPGELTGAAGGALVAAGAMLDPLVVATLGDARGEPLARLLAIVQTRDVHNAIVADALERCAADPSRPGDEVEMLRMIAAQQRRVLAERKAKAERAAEGSDEAGERPNPP